MKKKKNILIGIIVVVVLLLVFQPLVATKSSFVKNQLRLEPLADYVVGGYTLDYSVLSTGVILELDVPIDVALEKVVRSPLIDSESAVIFTVYETEPEWLDLLDWKQNEKQAFMDEQLYLDDMTPRDGKSNHLISYEKYENLLSKYGFAEKYTRVFERSRLYGGPFPPSCVHYPVIVGFPETLEELEAAETLRVVIYVDYRGTIILF